MRRNVQAVVNAKLPALKGPRIYSIEEKRKKDLHFEGSVLLPGLQNMCDCIYGRCNHS
jgi:hypothetical protein